MKIKKEFLMVLSTILTVYLAISFINLEINFKTWSEHTRVAFICLSFLSSLFIIIIISINDL
jgi:hypothetical protein